MKNDEKIEEKFHPDSSFDFPETISTENTQNGIKERKRKASPDWFKTWDWLHYEISKNAVFCFICKKACQNKTLLGQRIEAAFVFNGISDWKNATAKFAKHQESKYHIEAVEKDFVTRANLDIADMFSSENSKQKQQNWECLLKVFSTIRLLCRQRQAIRGHTDEESNYFQTLQFKAEFDKTFTAWMEKKSDRFISHSVQNEMIELIASSIITKIIDEIRNANFFATLMDETRDISNIEQATTCLRWVDKNLVVHEDFIGNLLHYLL